METIFDHNITNYEIELLSSFIPSRSIRAKDKYLERINKDQVYSDLYHLYLLRGDVVKAEKYLNKINDPEYKSLLSSF